eukprot:UN12457
MSGTTSSIIYIRKTCLDPWQVFFVLVDVSFKASISKVTTEPSVFKIPSSVSTFVTWNFG